MSTYDHDDYYVRNRSCRCLRCASHSLMGPAIIITVGVLLLLQELQIVPFGRSFPILLIVIGLVKIAHRSAPDAGHVQPAPYYPPGMQVPPPPVVPGDRGDSEVNRG